MYPENQNPQQRDLRLDFFRGLALITIFINHVPGTVFETWTSRNFGFSDAAEAFVLMSGIAAGLAYMKATSANLIEALKKVSRRAFKLYWVHLLISSIALLAVYSLTMAFSGEADLSANNMNIIQTHTVQTLVGLIFLTHQFGYLNILPLYCILLLLCPLFIRLAQKSTMLALSMSIAIWLTVGITQVNLPNYPGDGEWFLNPISWQLIFMIGIIIGVRKKQGRVAFPYHKLVYLSCVAYLLGACAVVQLQLWNLVVFFNVPEVIGQYSKTYAALPRLLHICALAYVVVHFSFSNTLANFRGSKIVVMLGSNSLPVFATGSVLCIIAQVIKNTYPFTTLQDAILLTSGLSIQIYRRAHHAKARFPRPLLSRLPNLQKYRLDFAAFEARLTRCEIYLSIPLAHILTLQMPTHDLCRLI
jgi:hypothetical protein